VSGESSVNARVGGQGISVLSVLVHSDLRFAKLWLRSLRECSERVGELLLADVNPTRTEEQVRAEVEAAWGGKASVFPVSCKDSVGHPVGLHRCLDAATGEYVLFSDPDVFYYMPGFDSFMVRRHEENGLLLSGVTHWSLWGHAYQEFPCVIQMLARRADLPPRDFLKGKLVLGGSAHVDIARTQKRDGSGDGLWLTRGAVRENLALYPKPDLLYDTGTNLFVWCHQRQGRWLAYTGKKPVKWNRFYRTRNHNNFGLKDDFGNLPLLYHQGRSSRENCKDDMFREYRAEWERRK
jgi:hypothetical protein